MHDFGSKFGRSALLAALLCFCVPSIAQRGHSDEPGSKEAAAQHFEAKVRPLLLNRCVSCHAGGKPKGNLRLDDAGFVGNPNIVVAGKPDQSPLIQVVEHIGEIKMPPKGKLSASEIADLKSWVKDGAVWPNVDGKGKRPTSDFRPTLWSMQPVKSPVIPSVRNAPWPRSPIDQFILAKLEANNLKPVGDAELLTLLRRLYFDLIGLPPTPEEVERFLRELAPVVGPSGSMLPANGDISRVVEKLLASPQYGERWGRHWMDVAHYADTAGDNADYPVPEARLYRDYIIRSFNADKPFDQFIREQIAGDLLAADGPSEMASEKIIATGFLALSRRYATAPYEFWYLTLEDTIDTVGQSIMGLTLRCARCHDHKFDPISMHDYYALYGIFASTQFPWAGGEEFQSKSTPRMHFVPMASASEVAAKTAKHVERKRRLKEEIEHFEKNEPLKKEIADLDAKVTELDRSLANAKCKPIELQAISSKRGELDKRRKSLKRDLQSKMNTEREELRLRERLDMPPDLQTAYAVTEGKPVDACIQQRGNPESKGPAVRRGDLKQLSFGHPLAIGSTESGRRQLAEWLTRPDHPLTARVMVNRIWQHHFGKGLVATPSNFGTRGSPPTHPELLDYLATEFVKSGWSIKHMHRLILSSRTWQLSSQGDATNAAVDPANNLHWRYDRRRLEAEAIRDSMFFVAGRLDASRPGEHPFPPITKWNWTQHNQFKAEYPTRHRSVYLMTQRLQRHPFLALFDGPDTNTTTGTRTTSTVPLQSLYLLNHPEVGDLAAAFARRLLSPPGDSEDRIRRAYMFAYSRPPRADEAARICNFLGQYAARLALPSPSKPSDELSMWTSVCRVLLTSNEFFYIE